jgi:hypothetical protein
MDCVYLCRNGNNEELRYSIRSVEKNLPHANIWVIGGKPPWYTGNFIKVSQDLSKYRNAVANLEALIESQDISEDFILMNDDFFVLKPVEAVQSFHKGYLFDSVEERKDLQIANPYINMMEATLDRLIKNGIENPLDYEVHVPMVMTKSGLKNVLRFGSLWRSMYGNTYNVGGTQMVDVKVHNPGPLESRSYDYINNDTTYLSSDDESFLTLRKNIFEVMFPMPSSYELVLDTSL